MQLNVALHLKGTSAPIIIYSRILYSLPMVNNARVAAETMLIRLSGSLSNVENVVVIRIATAKRRKDLTKVTCAKDAIQMTHVQQKCMKLRKLNTLASRDVGETRMTST